MHNRLPPSQPFIDFIGLYVTYKSHEWKTVLESLKYFFESITSYGKKLLKKIGVNTDPKPPVYDQIIATLDHFKVKFEDAGKQNDIKPWIDLIFDLRKAGNEAQSNKYENLISMFNLQQKNEYMRITSTLKDTLHGLADLIIIFLNNNEEFEAIKQALREDRNAAEAKCEENNKKAEGAFAKDSNVDLSIAILKLALMGDINAGIAAYYRASLDEPYKGELLPAKYPMPTKKDSANLLGHLKLPDDTVIQAFKLPNGEGFKFPANLPKLNRAAPLEIQPNFVWWVYASKYQPITQVDLLTFIKDSIKKGEQKKENSVKSENIDLLTQLNNDKTNAGLPTDLVQTAENNVPNKDVNELIQELNNSEEHHSPSETVQEEIAAPVGTTTSEVTPADNTKQNSNTFTVVPPKIEEVKAPTPVLSRKNSNANLFAELNQEAQKIVEQPTQEETKPASLSPKSSARFFAVAKEPTTENSDVIQENQPVKAKKHHATKKASS